MRIIFAIIAGFMVGWYTNSSRLAIATVAALASIGDGLDRIYEAIKEHKL